MCNGIDIGIDMNDLYKLIEIDTDCGYCGRSPVVAESVASGYREPGELRDGDRVVCPWCHEEGYIVASPDGSYVEWFYLIDC